MTAPYTGSVLRYAISDGKFNSGNPDSLVRQAAQWATDGIDFVQLREKQLGSGEIVDLTRRVMAAIREVAGKTIVLVNSRADAAVAAGADGVHLTAASGELTPAQVREIFHLAGRPAPVLSISCHIVDEVRRASQWGVDAILFGPVFGKEFDGVTVVDGVGLDMLRAACEAACGTKVLALGGVSEDLAANCIDAGAAGVAGIRLFQQRS